MSYQRPDGTTVQFVRPVHALIALHGERDRAGDARSASTPATPRSATASCREGVVQIQHADELRRARCSTKARWSRTSPTRKETHPHAAAGASRRRPGADAGSAARRSDALVEWPVVYACRFEDEFLQVPQECLILTMQTNQKYFALTDADGKLRSRFLIVSNIETDDAGRYRRRQRARGASAPGRRQVLLRAGQEEAARGSRAAARERGLSQQAGHAALQRVRARRSAGRRDRAD